MYIYTHTIILNTYVCTYAQSFELWLQKKKKKLLEEKYNIIIIIIIVIGRHVKSPTVCMNSYDEIIHIVFIVWVLIKNTKRTHTNLYTVCFAK